MSRYKTKPIIIGQMKDKWDIDNLKDFLKEELVFSGNKQGYVVNVDKIKVVEKPKAVFVESTCQYFGKKKAFELQRNNPNNF